MPIQVNAGDLVRTSLQFAHPVASLIENVYHWYVNGTGTCDPQDLVDTIETVLDFAFTNLWPAYHADTTFVQGLSNLLAWASTKWVNIGDLPAIPSFTHFLPAATGDPLPPSNAALVRFLTPSPKREGKKYFAPFSELYNDTDARVGSVLINELVGAASHILNINEQIGASNCFLQPVVLSPTQDLYNHPDAAIIRARWGVQRRRKEFVGA